MRLSLMRRGRRRCCRIGQRSCGRRGGDSGGVTGNSATAGATRTGVITEPGGGVTSSGGLSASGGSAGGGGTSTAGGPDASGDRPPSTEGTPCGSEDDCQLGSATYLFLRCSTPGESHWCGACLMGPGNCWSDADCVPDGGFTAGTMICDYPPNPCYCFPSTLCILGCRTNADCNSGRRVIKAIIVRKPVWPVTAHVRWTSLVM